MERESRTRLMTAMLLVVVFSAGLLLGLAADSSTLSAESPEVVAVGVAADTTTAEVSPRRRNMYQQVSPNEEQLALIETIMTEHRARTTALDAEMRTQSSAGFAVIVRETREAIKSVLTSEQAVEYQDLLDRYDARRAAERAAKAAEGETGDENR